jgi:hypothetical protein
MPLEIVHIRQKHTRGSTTSATAESARMGGKTPVNPDTGDVLSFSDLLFEGGSSGDIETMRLSAEITAPPEVHVQDREGDLESGPVPIY